MPSNSTIWPVHGLGFPLLLQQIHFPARVLIPECNKPTGRQAIPSHYARIGCRSSLSGARIPKSFVTGCNNAAGPPWSKLVHCKSWRIRDRTPIVTELAILRLHGLPYCR